ncbi:MAG: hypothetical protein LAT64_12185 [Phycisphaerales bacterium]|nr:hypothetical protein [Planctomycetota bacterium]MCH8509512.1 hypothetical protein [Phycisphaerales bacterium]
MPFRHTVVLGLSLILGSGAAFGQSASDAFTYQGSLTQSGAAYTGPATIALAFFTQQTGGSPVGSHAAAAEVTNGVFTIDIPLDAVGPAQAFDDLWVEITVTTDAGGTATLSPRQAVRSAPVAGYARSTRGVSVDGQGRVGLGTDAPTHAVHASGDGHLALLAESSSTIGTWLNIRNTSEGGRFWRLISSGQDNGEGAGNLLIGHGSEASSQDPVMTLLSNGRVGIGTESPQHQLDVLGVVGANEYRLTGTGWSTLTSSGLQSGFFPADGIIVRPGGQAGLRTASSSVSFTVRGQFPEEFLLRVEPSDGSPRFIVDPNGRSSFNGFPHPTTSLLVINASNRENAFWVTNPSGGTLFRVSSSGTLTAGGAKLFDIDHPMDPGMRLRHAVVESPEYGTQYRGRAVIGDDGRAEVELPRYFQALNTDAQYQLTCVGGFAPVYIESEVSDNRFVIAGGTPGLRVDWVVTAVRNDPWVHENPLEVEGPDHNRRAER